MFCCSDYSRPNTVSWRARASSAGGPASCPSRSSAAPTCFSPAFWSAPSMTVGHLLFSVATTGYILIAIQLEERDLIGLFGDQYRRYRKQVGMLLPLPFQAGSDRARAEAAPRDISPF